MHARTVAVIDTAQQRRASASDAETLGAAVQRTVQSLRDALPLRHVAQQWVRNNFSSARAPLAMALFVPRADGTHEAVLALAQMAIDQPREWHALGAPLHRGVVYVAHAAVVYALYRAPQDAIRAHLLAAHITQQMQ